jgi:hypothetical protein
VGHFLATLKDYPPRQKAASFNLDEVMRTITEQPGVEYAACGRRVLWPAAAAPCRDREEPECGVLPMPMSAMGH